MAADWVAEFTYPAGLLGPAGTPTLLGADGPTVSLVALCHAIVMLPFASVRVSLSET